MLKLFRTPLAALLLLAAAAPGFALELGDEAPELEVTEWIKGDAFALADGAGQKVFLIEFFTTFDPECKKAVPELSKWAKEYKDKGLVVLGITIENAVTVREYLDATEVGYSVAVDADNNTKAMYLEGVFKLPYAFIVDKGGKIAWKGNPLEGGKKVLKEVLDGTYDLERVVEIDKRRAALYKLLRGKRDNEKIKKAVDHVLELEPSDALSLRIRYDLFRQDKDFDGYKAFIRRLAEHSNDDEDALNGLAWRLVTQSPEWRDVEVAYGAAKRAVELTESKNGGILDTYARVLFNMGLLPDAIAAQKKAVAVEEDEDNKKDLERTLAYYETCLKLQKEHQKGKRKR